MPKQLIARIDGEQHIYIYDEVSSQWGFSAKDLIAELKNTKPDDRIIVHINSIGGSVFEGLAIYNILKTRSNVTTINEGVAASISSIVYLAGTTRKMFDNAYFMIHNPFMQSGGRKEELKRDLHLLEITEANMLEIYASNTTAKREDLTKWLLDETYFTAAEAKELGFVTEIISAPKVAATTFDPEKLVAKLRSLSPQKKEDGRPPPLPTKGKPKMDFDQWLAAECEVLDLELDKLTAKQRAGFQTKFEALKIDPAPKLPPKKAAPTVEDYTEVQAAEMDRIAAIEESANELTADSDSPAKLNADRLKSLGVRGTTLRSLQTHAVRNKWSVEKFELEARRATVVDIGHVGIHSKDSVSGRFMNEKATACALVKLCGIPAKAKHAWTGEEYGYEKFYDQKTLEASDEVKDASILQIYARVHELAFGYSYQGKLNTDGFIAKAREALHKLRASGNTTWTALNIFDDAANKVLWGAYQAQDTTWQEFVHKVNVSDFKQGNMYRMHFLGGYKKVAPDGMLKHGLFGDDKYTVGADTFGKIVGLSRTDLINDDLGAFNGIMAALGTEGARFLEELFWVHLMGQLATLFPTNNANANYLAGATTNLSVDGLSQAMTVFSNQVYDGAPMMMQPDLMLVGTAQQVVARELYTQTTLQGVQTANAKGRPDGNPHVGLYRPVVSGYMNNTAIKQRIPEVPGAAIPGQSATHYIIGLRPNTAMGGWVTGAFLNGRTTPFIEQADSQFDMLGLQWRAYQDAGAGNGDPKLAIYVKGIA